MEHSELAEYLSSHDICSYMVTDEAGNLHKIFDPEDFATLIYDNISYYQSMVEKYKSQYQEMRASYEEQIQNLKEALELCYGSFSTDEQRMQWLDFNNRHAHCRATKETMECAPYVIKKEGIAENYYTMVCPVCGEEEQITNV